MKQGIFLQNHLLYLLLAFFILNSCSIIVAKKKNPKEDKGISNILSVNAEQSTFLYCTKAAETIGGLELQGGNNMTWKGNASLTWDVDVSSNGRYELYLIANVREEGKGKTLLFKTNNQVYKFELLPTHGPFIGGRNFERIKLSSEIDLIKGVQKVALLMEEISTEDILIDIRSVELLPISAKTALEADKEKAVASRASVEWLNKSAYGLMFHWTSQSVNADGSHKNYEQAVNDFNVEKFANMVDETGAGYVIFTIGHAEQYCPAPIRSWEKCHPGKTTQRDLIVEIADALSKKGIKLVCYMHSLGTANFHNVNHQIFYKNFSSILEELGNRYKDKIAGYWFDCWYQIFEGYPDFPFEDFYKTTKIGNSDRIVCLNSWIYPPVTPWQDYWAGEVASPIEIPVNGYLGNGPVTDLPYQTLLIMEPYWVQQKAEMPEPRFTSKELAKYIKECNQNKGAVTINLGIYQDGTVGAKALQVMKEVKNIIIN